MAAWLVMPPPSVINAAARRIAGTQSGLVMGATSTSPVSNSAVSVGEVRTRTAPDALPVEAARPRTKIRAAAWSASRVCSCSVVMGQD